MESGATAAVGPTAVLEGTAWISCRQVGLDPGVQDCTAHAGVWLEAAAALEQRSPVAHRANSSSGLSSFAVRGLWCWFCMQPG